MPRFKFPEALLLRNDSGFSPQALLLALLLGNYQLSLFFESIQIENAYGSLADAVMLGLGGGESIAVAQLSISVLGEEVGDKGAFGT